jgi:maltooligosyltrehalose trehalohydrolase
LRLRRDEPALRPARQTDVDGAVLDAEAFVLRYFAPDGDDRLLLVNLGNDLKLSPAPEPLLAPPEGMAWQVLWSSERPAYGGCGTPPVERPDGWSILGESAVVLKPGPDPAGDVVI